MKKADMRKVQTLQNKAMRILAKKDFRTPTLELLNSTNMLSVNQLAAYSMETQVFKIFTSGQPDYHYERLFGRLDRGHTGTQTRAQLDQESRVDFRLSQGRGSFFYYACNLWNCLPAQVRNSMNTQELKRKAKCWTKQNIPVKV